MSVGFLDSILGGKKKLKRANLDKLFALSTAQVTLDVEQGLKPRGAAAVVYKPMSAGEFGMAADEMRELLHVVAREAGSEVERRSDDYGYEWTIIRDPHFEDLVTAVHLISSELQAKGFGEQLLAAVFPFEGGEHPVYLIYGYKRGTFWPFVPMGEDQKRDNATELRLKNELDGELPIEPDLTRWMGLFGAPL
jgi:PspA associated protein B